MSLEDALEILKKNSYIVGLQSYINGIEKIIKTKGQFGEEMFITRNKYANNCISSGGSINDNIDNVADAIILYIEKFDYNVSFPSIKEYDDFCEKDKTINYDRRNILMPMYQIVPNDVPRVITIIVNEGSRAIIDDFGKFFHCEIRVTPFGNGKRCLTAMTRKLNYDQTNDVLKRFGQNLTGESSVDWQNRTAIREKTINGRDMSYIPLSLYTGNGVYEHPVNLHFANVEHRMLINYVVNNVTINNITNSGSGNITIGGKKTAKPIPNLTKYVEWVKENPPGNMFSSEYLIMLNRALKTKIDSRKLKKIMTECGYDTSHLINGNIWVKNK